MTSGERGAETLTGGSWAGNPIALEFFCVWRLVTESSTITHHTLGQGIRLHWTFRLKEAVQGIIARYE